MENFAEVVRNARKEAGLTQQSMSDHMDIPKRTIEEWESGRNIPAVYIQRFVLKELKEIAEEKGSKKMKPTYDICISSRGIHTWSEGHFEEMAKLCIGHFDAATDLVTIESPDCFLRVHKNDINSDEYIAYIRGFFARYRVHPTRPTWVQWSKKRGQWVNDKTFMTEEAALAFVEERNARLIPFAGSPYIVEE